MISTLPAADFLAFLHRLKARGHDHLRNGNHARALRCWHAGDRLLCRRVARRPA